MNWESSQYSSIDQTKIQTQKDPMHLLTIFIYLQPVHDTDNIGTRKSTFSNFVPPFLELPKKSVLVSIGTSKTLSVLFLLTWK